jgi:RNA polymerase sigma-70 factor, ECF subfamily
MTDAERQRQFEKEALVHLEAIFRTAQRLTGHREEAEEIVQETFLKAYRAFDRYEPGTNARAWLFRILRNTFLNRYERKKREAGNVALDEMEPFLGAEDPDLGLSPESYDDLLGRVLEDDVRAALMALPEAYRTVVVLSDMEGLSYREIAEAVEIPIGTVMSRLFRGRRALRRDLVAAARRHGIDPGVAPGRK